MRQQSENSSTNRWPIFGETEALLMLPTSEFPGVEFTVPWRFWLFLRKFWLRSFGELKESRERREAPKTIVFFQIPNCCQESGMCIRKLVFRQVEMRAGEKHTLVCSSFHYVNCVITCMKTCTCLPSLCGVPFSIYLTVWGTIMLVLKDPWIFFYDHCLKIEPEVK